MTGSDFEMRQYQKINPRKWDQGLTLGILGNILLLFSFMTYDSMSQVKP